MSPRPSPLQPSISRHALRHAAWGLSLLGAVSLVRPAPAQEAQDVAAARTLGQKGTLAAQAGRCEEAVDLLTRARALMPVPSVLTPLGECQIKLGKLVDGTESLQASSRAELEANAPKAYIKAQVHARELLQATLPRLGHLVIEVKAPKGLAFKVTDNAIPVSEVLVGVERAVDPGKHSIEVTAPGFLPGRVSIQIGEGQKERAPIELTPDPHAPPPAKPPPPGLPPERRNPDEPVAPQQGRGNGQLIAGVVTVSVGGVALALGGVFGGLALSKRSSLDGVCTNRHCPTTSQGDIDSMKTFANTSTALLVVGGAAAVAGTVVLVTVPSNGPAAPATGPTPPRQGFRVSPYVGLGTFGAIGSF